MYLLQFSFLLLCSIHSNLFFNFLSEIQTDFRLVSYIAAGITLLTILILFFIPESPVFLSVKNKMDKARNALSMLRNIRKFCENLYKRYKLTKFPNDSQG